MDHWISVGDHYPVGDMEVLAITRQGFQFIGRYVGKDYRGVDQWRLKTERSERTIFGKVTHWMRKPKDPVAQSAECGFESHPDYNTWCPKCGARIEGVVDVEQIVLHADTDRELYYPSYEITPGSCPACGTIFTHVTLPVKLPFEGY